MNFLSSINEMSAAEGLPVVLLGALQAFGALALIVLVLVIMDRVYRKKQQGAEEANENNSEIIEEHTGDSE